MISLVIVIRVGLETAIAAQVTILITSTVNELLLREALKLARGDEMGTLERAGRREGPA